MKKTLGKSDHLYFLIGMDAFKDIAKWYKSEELLAECDFIVAARPGYSLADVASSLPAEAAADRRGDQTVSQGEDRRPARALRSHAPPAARDARECFSHADSRGRRAAGALKKLVPDAVAEYIHKEQCIGNRAVRRQTLEQTRADRMKKNELRAQVAFAVQACQEKKADNITVLQLDEASQRLHRLLSALFGHNPRQVQAIADEIDHKLSAAGVEPKHTEGYNQAEWLLMDYVDFVVHIFSENARKFYDLERLWKTATRIDPAELVKPARKKAAKRVAAKAATPCKESEDGSQEARACCLANERPPDRETSHCLDRPNEQLPYPIADGRIPEAAVALRRLRRARARVGSCAAQAAGEEHQAHAASAGAA